MNRGRRPFGEHKKSQRGRVPLGGGKTRIVKPKPNYAAAEELGAKFKMPAKEARRLEDIRCELNTGIGEPVERCDSIIDVMALTALRENVLSGMVQPSLPEIKITGRTSLRIFMGRVREDHALTRHFVDIRSRLKLMLHRQSAP